MGEIIFDGEIPYGDETRLDTGSSILRDSVEMIVSFWVQHLCYADTNGSIVTHYR